MSLRNRQKHPLIKQGWVRAVLLFVVYLTSALLMSMVIGLYAVEKGSDNVSYLWIVASSLLAVLIVFIFRKFIDRRPFKSMDLALSDFYPGGIIGFLIGVFLVCTGGLIIYFVGGLKWTDILFSKDIFSSLAVLLLVAFSEELVFRGYILRNLLKSFNQWLSLAISAFLFTLVHLMNPGIPVMGVINIILGGLVLGIAFMYTRNLWMPVLFHFAWNFFQGPVLGFPVSGLSFKTILTASLSGSDLISGGSFGFEGSVICTALLLATFLFFLFSRRFF
jgi:membrane protease YdiL (CAAX protease family)